MEKKENISKISNLVSFSYLYSGFYANQLTPWLKEFSKNQILILRYEDLKSEPKKIPLLISEFLNIPYMDNLIGKSNVGSYKDMNQETRQWLSDYYKPHNEKLYSLLDTNFNWD